MTTRRARWLQLILLIVYWIISAIAISGNFNLTAAIIIDIILLSALVFLIKRYPLTNRTTLTATLSILMVVIMIIPIVVFLFSVR